MFLKIILKVCIPFYQQNTEESKGFISKLVLRGWKTIVEYKTNVYVLNWQIHGMLLYSRNRVGSLPPYFYYIKKCELWLNILKSKT